MEIDRLDHDRVNALRDDVAQDEIGDVEDFEEDVAVRRANLVRGLEFERRHWRAG